MSSSDSKSQENMPNRLLEIVAAHEARIDRVIAYIFEETGKQIPNWIPDADRKRFRETIGQKLPNPATPLKEAKYATEILSVVVGIYKCAKKELVETLLSSPFNGSDALHLAKIYKVITDGPDALPLLLGPEATNEFASALQSRKSKKGGSAKKGSEGELKRVIRRLAGMVESYNELIRVLDDEDYSESTYDEAIRYAREDPINFVPEGIDQNAKRLIFRLNGQQETRALKTIQNIYNSL